MIKNNRARFLMKLVFLAYLIGLFMITLLPDGSNITYETTYNLVPITSIDNFFYDIVANGIIDWDYLATNPTDMGEIIRNIFTSSFINLFGNIILFVPLGLLYPLSRKRKVKFFEILLVCLGSTVLIEVVQFFFLTSRRADVDDVILNFIGGMIGYLIYKWME